MWVQTFSEICTFKKTCTQPIVDLSMQKTFLQPPTATVKMQTEVLGFQARIQGARYFV